MSGYVLTPAIRIGLSTTSPWAELVLTVIVWSGDPPVPARILLIPTSLALTGPTISYSGRVGCISEVAGKSPIALPELSPKAFCILWKYIERSVVGDETPIPTPFTPSAYSNTVNLWWEKWGENLFVV